MTVHTSENISTNLVLPLANGPLSAESYRLFIHHEVQNEILDIYVPADKQQRQVCYRSQLPRLLVSLMGVGISATFSVSNLAACSLQDIDEILLEHDISDVWIGLRSHTSM